MAATHRHILLTGASGGIGAATAAALADRNTRLTLVARNPERLRRLADNLASRTGGVVTVAADLGAAGTAAQVIAEATAAQDAIDVLVNCAGVNDFGRFADASPERIETLVVTNLLAPTSSTDPRRRLNDLCDRLWLIAAIEHYTAVLGDFVLNCAWEDYDADPTMTDVFRWHGSEEVEHRSVAHDVAVYFQDSYFSRVRAMSIAATAVYLFFQRGCWALVKRDPTLDLGWWRMQRLRMADSKLGLLPKFSRMFGSNTLTYCRPGFSPEEMGSTAQAVAYLASSPAARAAHL